MADPVTENTTTEINEEDPVTVADKPREPTEYEKRLRRESAKHRTEAKVARDELDAFKRNTDATIEAIRKSAKEETDARIIRSELKAAALKAGMVDLDFLKLIDISGVTLNEKGDIEGADALMAKAKESKPHMFGQTSTTSSTQPAPTPKPTTQKLAKDMTPEEYKAAMDKFRAA
jgi:hypothetical protein